MSLNIFSQFGFKGSETKNLNLASKIIFLPKNKEQGNSKTFYNFLSELFNQVH